MVDGKVSERALEWEDTSYRESKEIFDEATGTLNISKIIVTDAKYNSRAFPPRQAESTHEIKI